jgi:hypothetical protein
MKKEKYEKTVLTLLWVIAILSVIQFLGFSLQGMFSSIFWH